MLNSLLKNFFKLVIKVMDSLPIIYFNFLIKNKGC